MGRDTRHYPTTRPFNPPVRSSYAASERSYLQEWLNMWWGDGSKRAVYAYLYGAEGPPNARRGLTEEAAGRR